MEYTPNDFARLAICMNETACLAVDTILRCQAGLEVLGGDLYESVKFMEQYSVLQSVLAKPESSTIEKRVGGEQSVMVGSESLATEKETDEARPASVGSESSANEEEVNEVRSTLVEPRDSAIGEGTSETTGEVDVFRQLQIAIAEGNYREKFPVGTLLPDTWTDPETDTEYIMPHRIMGYQVQKLADGGEALGAILCRENTLPKLMKFDESRVFFGGSSLEEYLNADYLVGCSPELRKAVTEVVIGESSPDDSREVCCKVFIPSAEDLHVNIGNRSQNELDKLCWEYFRGTPTNWNDNCAERIVYDLNGNAQYVWLRSRASYRSVCYVYPDGYVGLDDPSSSDGVLPACVIVGGMRSRNRQGQTSV